MKQSLPLVRGPPVYGGTWSNENVFEHHISYYGNFFISRTWGISQGRKIKTPRFLFTACLGDTDRFTIKCQFKFVYDRHDVGVGELPCEDSIHKDACHAARIGALI